MTTEADIEGAKLNLDAYIVLFSIDMSNLGGGILGFTQSAKETGPVMWNGFPFYPVDLEADGFEWSGRGALPTPRIKISNVNRVLSALVNQYNDLLGSTITRVRTFRKFLDDGDSPDTMAHFPLDVYKIERKVNHNKIMIEWELAAAMDQEGKMIPGRQILRDACTHRYWVWNAAVGNFNTSEATCPYRGERGFFDEQGRGLSGAEISKDRCGKKLSDCKLRFPKPLALPTRAFPGASRFRVR